MVIPTPTEINAPEGSCCETYWDSYYGGCGNPHNC
jgi:hypothetical protein